MALTIFHPTPTFGNWFYYAPCQPEITRLWKLDVFDDTEHSSLIEIYFILFHIIVEWPGIIPMFIGRMKSGCLLPFITVNGHDELEIMALTMVYPTR